MLVGLLKKEEFKGKKNGIEYVKIAYAKMDGGVGELFCEKEEWNKFSIGSEAFVDIDEFAGVLEKLPRCHVDFDEKGRLVDVSVAEEE
jgi:hypothetical protein